MADFDDSADPELGAACNRLAAWVEPLPEGQVIDQNSGLTERDLAMILCHLYTTRGDVPATVAVVEEGTRLYGSPSVPVVKKRPWG